MSMTTIRISNIRAEGRTVLCLSFPRSWEIIELVRELEGRRWVPEHLCWHATASISNLQYIDRYLGKVALLDKSNLDYGAIEEAEASVTAVAKRCSTGTSKFAGLSEDSQQQIREMVALMRGRRYAESTVRTYGGILIDFLLLINAKPLVALSNDDIERFNQEFILKRNYSISFQRQFIGAIKMFCKAHPNCGIDVPQLVRPRKEFKLPLVLSKEEILDLLRNTRNIKHRTALAMIYAAGLRISELLTLELCHIDIDRRQVRIIHSKGRKDRYVVLAQSFILLLGNYLATYSPQKYFVEGASGGQYSAESIRAVLRRSCERAGIRKHVTPHTLRHSYATHLLESGVDLRYIQELLGHAKPETTMIYTHVSRKDLLDIKSPLDTVVEEFANRDKPNQNILLSRNDFR